MFKNLFDLTGRRILITGSNGGIGNSLALGLAQHGATVLLNGRNPDKLHAATEKLRQQGLSAEEARFDVTNEEEVVKGIALLDTMGGVDVLVNNAGIQRRISLEKVDLDTWNEVLKTNLTSAMLVSREINKRMIERNNRQHNENAIEEIGSSQSRARWNPGHSGGGNAGFSCLEGAASSTPSRVWRLQ